MNIPTYLGTIIFGFPVWLILFWKRKDLRHKMLIMGILVSFLAVTELFWIPNYWQPVVFFPIIGGKVDILAFVFCFITGGVSTALYEEIMGERDIREPKNRHHKLKSLILIPPILSLILVATTSLNFMWITLIGLSVGILIIVLVRNDLIWDVLYSGLFSGIVYSLLLIIYLAVFPDVLKVWNLRSFPQYLVLNVPHFEIIWGILTGAFLGPVYELMNDYDVRKIPVRKVRRYK